MSYTKQDLQALYNLSAAELEQALTTAGLSLEQETYADEEIQNSEAIFNRRHEERLLEPQATAKKSRKKLEISELLSLASRKCKTRIKLTDANDILVACGLPDQEEYTASEGDRFLEACDLYKNQGKTLAEVASHFGVDTVDLQADLIAELQEMLADEASSVQLQQIREILPQLALKQLQEIKAAFSQGVALRLREYIESGNLEAEIRQASNNVLKSGNATRLLNSSWSSPRNHKNLLGSSTNASTNE